MSQVLTSFCNIKGIHVILFQLSVELCLKQVLVELTIQLTDYLSSNYKTFLAIFQLYSDY
jgi:hypothetical protein